MKPNHIKPDFLYAIVIFTFAFLVRVWISNSIMGGDYRFVMWDDDDYHQIALSFLDDHTLFDGSNYAYRLPVFPLLLSFIYSIKRDPSFVSIFLLGLSASVPVGTFYLGRKWFGVTTGLIAGILVAVDINLVFYAPLLMTETLAVALVLGFFLVFEGFIDKPAVISAVFLGILLGLMVLTRVNLGIFLVAALLGVFLNRRNLSHWHLRRMIIPAIVAFLIWSLWVIRNAVVLSAFVPFTTQSGSAYFGVYNNLAASCGSIQDCGYWINMDLPDHVAKLEEVEKDRSQRIIAASWIDEHPTLSLKIAFLQAVHFWRPTWFMDYIIYGLAGFSLVKPMANKRKPGIILLLISIVLSSAFAVLSIGVERFHLPFLPGLYLLAASSITFMWKTLRRMRRKMHSAEMG